MESDSLASTVITLTIAIGTGKQVPVLRCITFLISMASTDMIQCIVHSTGQIIANAL
jgi:hypothetical protein